MLCKTRLHSTNSNSVIYLNTILFSSLKWIWNTSVTRDEQHLNISLFFFLKHIKCPFSAMPHTNPPLQTLRLLPLFCPPYFNGLFSFWSMIWEFIFTRPLHWFNVSTFKRNILMKHLLVEVSGDDFKRRNFSHVGQPLSRCYLFYTS